MREGSLCGSDPDRESSLKQGFDCRLFGASNPFVSTISNFTSCINSVGSK